MAAATNLIVYHTKTRHISLPYIINWITELAKVKQAKLRWRKQNIILIWTWKLLDYHLIWIIRLEFNFLQFYWTKIFMLNLNKNGTWTSFLYIKKSCFWFETQLETWSFWSRNILYKVRKLLVITLHNSWIWSRNSWIWTRNS